MSRYDVLRTLFGHTVADADGHHGHDHGETKPAPAAAGLLDGARKA